MSAEPGLRASIEDFLFFEAALLDEWRLDEWLALLADDAVYEVPPNDRPEGDSHDTLFIIADDIARIRARVKRLNDPDAHAEYPRSRTRRLITNVRVLSDDGKSIEVAANFAVWRYRRNGPEGVYVGHYAYTLRRGGDEGFLIAKRRAVLDSEALGSLGSVSFIL